MTHERIFPLKKGRTGHLAVEFIFQYFARVLGQISEWLCRLPIIACEPKILADGTV